MNVIRENRNATKTVFEVLGDSFDKVIPAETTIEVEGEYPSGAVHAWLITKQISRILAHLTEKSV